MIAIPAIDMLNDRIVRLYQGDFEQQTNYSLDPVQYAREIQNAGLEFLHLVDLSGAKEGSPAHIEVLKAITSGTNLNVDFGGGIKNLNDVVNVLRNGANQVVIGSLCVTQPAEVIKWITEFGAEKFILALDTDGEVLKINGWQDKSEVKLEDTMCYFSEIEELTILTTDIRRDGTGNGTNTELYRSLLKQFPKQKWIASGGVETVSDLVELGKAGCYGCVVGKALLDGKITLSELKTFNDAGL